MIEEKKKKNNKQEEKYLAALYIKEIKNKIITFWLKKLLKL